MSKLRVVMLMVGKGDAQSSVTMRGSVEAHSHVDCNRQVLSVARAEAKRAEEESGLDPLEAFMQGIKSTTNTEVLSRQRRLERDLQRELTEVEGLLAISKPALESLLRPTAVHKPAPPPNEPQAEPASKSTERPPAQNHGSSTAPVVEASAAPRAKPVAQAAAEDPAPAPSEQTTESDSTLAAAAAPQEKAAKVPSSTHEFAAPALPGPTAKKKRRVYSVARPSTAQLEAASAAMDRQVRDS
jgi:hypothetical protein